MECQIVVPFRIQIPIFSHCEWAYFIPFHPMHHSEKDKSLQMFNALLTLQDQCHISPIFRKVHYHCSVGFILDPSVRKSLGNSKDFLTCGQLKALSRFWGSVGTLIVCCSSNVAYAQCARSHLYLSAVLAWVGFRSSLVRPANPGIRRCLVRLTLRLDLLPFIRHHQLLRAVLRSRCWP